MRRRHRRPCLLNSWDRMERDGLNSNRETHLIPVDISGNQGQMVSCMQLGFPDMSDVEFLQISLRLGLKELMLQIETLQQRWFQHLRSQKLQHSVTLRFVPYNGSIQGSGPVTGDVCVSYILLAQSSWWCWDMPALSSWGDGACPRGDEHTLVGEHPSWDILRHAQVEGHCPGGGHPSWGILVHPGHAPLLQARPCWEMLPSPTLAQKCTLAWISFFPFPCQPFLWEEVLNGILDYHNLDHCREKSLFLSMNFNQKSFTLSKARLDSKLSNFLRIVWPNRNESLILIRVWWITDNVFPRSHASPPTLLCIQNTHTCT